MKGFEIHKIFRDRTIAEKIARAIKSIKLDKRVRIMHVCGTHEQTITRHGIRALLPRGVEVVPGPGCPVCITPSNEIDETVYLASQGNTIVTYGDMFRVPGTLTSLAQEKAKGRDIRLVYSPEKSVEFARENPEKEIIFFGIGFETTAPMTAQILLNNPPENFSVLCSHRFVPPALDFLLNLAELNIDGFIDPGHVSTIIGMRPYEPLSEAYGIPQVITGFEPVDVLIGILMLLRQIKNCEAKVENEYVRSVTYEGNLIAQEMMDEVFESCTREWRGLPVIPDASMRMKREFEEWDASKKFDFQIPKVSGDACGIECPLCGNILRGISKPQECDLFGKTCTPRNPVGACMVSTEGTCNIAYRYGTTILE